MQEGTYLLNVHCNPQCLRRLEDGSQANLSPDRRYSGSFTATGGQMHGPLNWALVNRITRAQWEKSMASCCLGIVLQHRWAKEACCVRA
jgi:hypothetical protein